MSWRSIQGGAPERENVFDELCRYVRFGEYEHETLRTIGRFIVPHATAIADEFYTRLEAHEQARRVFTGPEQMARLHRSLIEWIEQCFSGPWDDTYYQRRARIGRMHVRIDLAQRYMFGAMNVMRESFIQLLERAPLDAATLTRGRHAINKLLDLELAIMLETYREAFMHRVQDTEREHQKSLERLLALAHARYDQIVEQGDALVVTFDKDGRIVLFNTRCESLTGLSRQDAVGRNFLDIFFRDSGQDEVRAHWQAALAGRPGSQVAHDLVVDSTRYFLRWQFTHLPSDNGPLLCALGLDITEAKIMYERAKRAEHLAQLGEMAAGLAHEIRNPLNAAHLQLTLVQRRLAKVQGQNVSAIEDAARVVASELQRLATLVSDFLQFARPKSPQLSSDDLPSTVRDVVELVRPEANAAGVALSTTLPDTLSTSFDGEYIKQVLFNLIRNAIEACEPGDRVVVDLRRDGNDALLCVRDSGKGLPTDASRIFEPFFTTKDTGTGLGLAIVHRIISAHGGSIDANTADGETTFAVRLPLSH